MPLWPFKRAKPVPAPTPAGLPQEKIIGLQGEDQDGKPMLWMVNQGLDTIAGGPDFPWHLSLVIEMAETVGEGLPTPAEIQFLKSFGGEIRARLEAHSNAVLLISGTCDGQRQLVFRVRDPAIANAYLQELVGNPNAARPMEYRMERDSSWKLAERYLRPARKLA